MQPNSGVEFIPFPTSSEGRLFFINPCISRAPAAPGFDPEATTEVDEPRAAILAPTDQLSLDPNPFTQHLNIRYAFQSDEPSSSVTINLLDYSGRLLQTIHRRQDCPPPASMPSSSTAAPSHQAFTCSRYTTGHFRGRRLSRF